MSDLEQAGHRAAAQPVPPARALADIERRAGRMALARRVAGGSVAVVAVFALGVGLAFAVNGRSDSETIVAGEPVGEAMALASAAAPVQDADESVPPAVTPSAVEDSGPVDDSDSVDDSESVDVAPDGEDALPLHPSIPGHASKLPGLFDWGDEQDRTLEWSSGHFGFGMRYLKGTDAQAAADVSAESADDVRSIGDLTVWIEHREGDVSALSMLVDDDTFVEVTGHTEFVERYLGLFDDEGLPFLRGFEPTDDNLGGWFDEEWLTEEWFDEEWLSDDGGLQNIPSELRDLLDMRKNGWDDFRFDDQNPLLDDAFGERGRAFQEYLERLEALLESKGLEGKTLEGDS